MPDLLTAKSLRFFEGSMFNIAGPTALLELEINAEIPEPLLTELESVAALQAMNPGDPLPGPGLGQGDWAAPFLIGGRGTSRLADLTAGLIVALTLWARLPMARAEVVSATPGLIRLALYWQHRATLREVIKLAIEHVSALAAPERAKDQPPETIARIETFLKQAQSDFLVPNTMRFAWAAVERDIPITAREGRVLRVGWGANAHLLQSSFTGETPSVAARLARHKFDSLQLLARSRIPTPPGHLVRTSEEARTAAAEMGWPVVVKPVSLDQGIGVAVGLDTEEDLDRAYEIAASKDKLGVVVEGFVPGEDHRMLVVRGQLLMASRRIPGGVTGDGVSTVDALIDQLNADPLRSSDPRSMKIAIKRDDEADACLASAGLTLDSIPQQGLFVPLRRTANISTGGTAIDVTDQVHPDNALAAIRAADIIGLDIAGVDFLSPDISRSFHEVGGAICEVNAQPGFRPHWLSDPDRDINGEILDILFRDHPARIPTAAITGTNGKSTTAMMLHHIWVSAGKVAGVCTTAGTWIGRHQIDSTNLSGQPGAAVLLQDPAVEAAVLEMPRRGLILFGQACDQYDVAAFLNVQDDHIGQDGIETLDQMAQLKAGVILRARNAVVINAEDPRCLARSRTAPAPRHILVAMDPAEPALSTHLERGGDGVFVAPQDGEDWIFMARGAQHVPIIRVSDIPATLDGRLRFNIMNAMFAIALADAQELPGRAIRAGLSSFQASREMNPGRYNMIQGFPFRLIVDYAHNEVGVSELCHVVQDMTVPGKRILALRTLGTSGPAEVNATARILIDTFDHICVLPDTTWILKNGFFKSDDPIGEMLDVTRQTLLDHGARPEQVQTSRDDQAILHGMLGNATAGDLVVMMADPNAAFRHIDSFRAGQDTAAE